MTACFWQVIPCRIGVGKCHHLIICSLFFYETNLKSLSVLGEALGSLGLSSTANQPRCRSRTWKRTILKKACMRKEEQDAAQQCLKVITVCTFFFKARTSWSRVILLLSLLHQGLLLRRRNEPTKLIPTPLQNINKNRQKEERIEA